MTQPTEEKKTPVEIICDIAGLDAIDDIPSAVEFVWGGKTTFKVNDPVPLEGLEGFTVYAMFQEEHEVRIYATPKPPETPETPVPLPRRITLNKANSSRFIETIRFDVFFQQALPNELRWQHETLIDAPEEGYTEDDIAAALTKTKATPKYIEAVLKVLEAEDEDESPPKTS